MNILEKILKSTLESGETIAFRSRQGSISYDHLWDESDRLASWLENKLKGNKKPVVVYGHKSPLMLVAFLACVKSGRAYCPVDTSMPLDRTKAIIEAVGNSIVLTAEDLPDCNKEIVNLRFVEDYIKGLKAIDRKHWVKDEDIFYIIFTSGSTGAPKGVTISSENLSRYTDWSVTLGDPPASKKKKVFLNQAPFSFDLSVMDLYTSLASGGILWSIDKELQQDSEKLMAYLKEGDINYWVSTPSFANMCLAEKSFDSTLLKNMNAFLFCGETLTKETAKSLMNRFPNSVVVNTYGPTESTVAVTETRITREMLEADEALPIGRPRPGTEIRIIKEDGSKASDGEKGEILILGNTVSPGYFNNPEKTAEVFGMAEMDGKKVRCYSTGDEGYVKQGMVYYSGRIDLQIKLHGYRIELGDIESNLMKIDGIKGAAVIPKKDGERIRYLAGMVVSPGSEGDFQDRKRIRTSLKELLPEYMVPKKIVFIDNLPMTGNGKVDRRRLEEYL